MKILLRADASIAMGSGHVMRCLTLARALISRGHESILLVNNHGIPWLSDELSKSGVKSLITETKKLDAQTILNECADVVVVDSYWIDGSEITALNKVVDVVAIVDGEPKGIESALYINHNLGAENNFLGINNEKVLAGSNFALVREEIFSISHSEPKPRLPANPSVLVFAGGTDAAGAIPFIYSALDQVSATFSMTVVVGTGDVPKQTNFKHSITFVPTTAEFDDLLSKADLVVAAAGTSSWEICTVGIPSVFLAVVPNQLGVIRAIEKFRCGEVVDLTTLSDDAKRELSTKFQRLITRNDLRKLYIENCRRHFDGEGTSRVVNAIERLKLNK